jgi:hypothetical protein
MNKAKLDRAILTITLVTILCFLTLSAAFAGTTELDSNVWSGNGHTYHLLANI